MRDIRTIKPEEIDPLQKLGVIPSSDPHANALQNYALQTSSLVELILTDRLDTQAQALMLMANNSKWFAQEQVKAFNHNATAHEFSRWAADELLKRE